MSTCWNCGDDHEIDEAVIREDERRDLFGRVTEAMAAAHAEGYPRSVDPTAVALRDLVDPFTVFRVMGYVFSRLFDVDTVGRTAYANTVGTESSYIRLERPGVEFTKCNTA